MAAAEWDDFSDATAGFDTSSLPDGAFLAKITKRVDGSFKGSDGSPAGRTLAVTYEILEPPVPEGGEADPELVGEVFTEKMWLNRPEAREILMKSLKRIGFSVDSWGKSESEFPRATMVPLALKYATLRGLTLKMSKKTNNSKGKDYVNLFINGRVKHENDPELIPNELVLGCASEPESSEELF